MNVEVCPIALPSAWGKVMAQVNDSNGFAARSLAAPAAQPTLAAVVSPDRNADPVAIFSAPDVVFHWWAESKRRWAEESRARALGARPIARVADQADNDGY